MLCVGKGGACVGAGGVAGEGLVLLEKRKTGLNGERGPGSAVTKGKPEGERGNPNFNTTKAND